MQAFSLKFYAICISFFLKKIHHQKFWKIPEFIFKEKIRHVLAPLSTLNATF